MQKLYILVLGCWIFCFTAYAQSTEKIFLWPGEVPGETKEKSEPVLASDRGDQVTRIAEVTNPTLEVFRPARNTNNGAGVIVCPGGGYQILAVDKEGYEMAQWLSDLGYTARYKAFALLIYAGLMDWFNTKVKE